MLVFNLEGIDHTAQSFLFSLQMLRLSVAVAIEDIAGKRTISQYGAELPSDNVALIVAAPRAGAPVQRHRYQYRRYIIGLISVIYCVGQIVA